MSECIQAKKNRTTERRNLPTRLPTPRTTAAEQSMPFLSKLLKRRLVAGRGFTDTRLCRCATGTAPQRQSTRTAAPWLSSSRHAPFDCDPRFPSVLRAEEAGEPHTNPHAHGFCADAEESTSSSRGGRTQRRRAPPSLPHWPIAASSEEYGTVRPTRHVRAEMPLSTCNTMTSPRTNVATMAALR